MLRSVRWWWWRRSKVQMWIIKWGTAGFLVDLALFAAVGFRLRSTARALDVLLGAVSPFTFKGSWTAFFTVPLAILSWLLVPALTGAIIGALLDESVKQWSMEEAERVKRALELTAAKEAERIRRKEERKRLRRERQAQRLAIWPGTSGWLVRMFRRGRVEGEGTDSDGMSTD